MTTNDRRDDLRPAPVVPEAPASRTLNATTGVRLDRWASRGIDLGPIILPVDRPTCRAEEIPLDVQNACRRAGGLPALPAQEG